MWRTFLAQPDVVGVAVCDVYEPFLNRAAQMAGGKVATYRDFRKLLADKEIDVVIVAPPDHWHAIQTIEACRAGKDVYVEKPLCRMQREGRAMVRAARQHHRVVQVGSQQRSGTHYHRAIELIRGGALGSVHHITANRTRNTMPGFRPIEPHPQPGVDLDWDLRLGPAPQVPFDPLRCMYNYRWFWDYSGGQMTNWGAHSLDIARWGLGANAPAAVSAFGGRFAIQDGGETPDVQVASYQFPGCIVSWTGREINAGRTNLLKCHGTKGNMILTREGFEVSPEVGTGYGQDGKREAMAAMRESGGNLDRLHVRNFLECVKSRAKPHADVEEGHLTATMCQLANIATRVGRVLKWDADREEVTGDPEANKRLFQPYRKPWSLT